MVRVNPQDDSFKSSYFKSSEVFRDYQMQIHNDPPDECDIYSFTRFLVDSPLAVRSNFIVTSVDIMLAIN